MRSLRCAHAYFGPAKDKGGTQKALARRAELCDGPRRVILQKVAKPRVPEPDCRTRGEMAGGCCRSGIRAGQGLRAGGQREVARVAPGQGRTCCPVCRWYGGVGQFEQTDGIGAVVVRWRTQMVSPISTRTLFSEKANGIASSSFVPKPQCPLRLCNRPAITTNSSPPRRATRSLWRNTGLQAPGHGPRAVHAHVTAGRSLTGLNPSRSIMYTASIFQSCRTARARRKCWLSPRRLGQAGRGSVCESERIGVAFAAGASSACSAVPCAQPSTAHEGAACPASRRTGTSAKVQKFTGTQPGSRRMTVAVAHEIH